MKRYEINITYKCNWRCDYCAMKRRLDEPVSGVLELVSGIPDGSVLTLSGGEPGTCSREYLEAILDVCRSKKLVLYLNTNGLFLRRFPDMTKEFSGINLHLDPRKPMPEADVNLVLILTKTNQEEILEFVKGADKKFDIIPATFPDEHNNPQTVRKIPLCLLRHMTKRSLEAYFSNSRYKDVVYLN